jgi:hypothetical protein
MPIIITKIHKPKADVAAPGKTDSTSEGNIQLVCQFGKNKHDVAPSNELLSVTELFNILRTPDGYDKDGSYIQLLAYQPGTNRKKHNVTLVYGYVADLDEENLTEDEIYALIKGLCALVISTYHSHCNGHRWRVFIPFKTPVPPWYFSAIHAHFKDIFKCALDDASKNAVACWYRRRIVADNGLRNHEKTGKEFKPHDIAFETSGDLFDPLPFKDEAVALSELKASSAIDGSHGDEWPEKKDLALSALAHLVKSASADDYTNWIKVGMALKDCGAPPEVWIDWSKSSPKFTSEVECLYKWNTFAHSGDMDGGVTLGTLFHIAKESSWEYDPLDSLSPEAKAKNASTVTTLGQTLNAKATFLHLEKAETAPAPPSLDAPSGLTNDLANYYATALPKQITRELQVAAALFTIAAGAANQYAIAPQVPIQPNLLVLAGTGAGKSSLLEAIRSVLQAANAHDILTAQFASEQAVFVAVSKGPVAALIDEVGTKLKQAMQPGGYHTSGVIQAIMELYGQGTSHYLGKVYADPKKNVEAIAYPFLLPMLFSQKATFSETLTSVQISNGRLNRLLLVDGGDSVLPYNDGQICHPSAEILKALSMITSPGQASSTALMPICPLVLNHFREIEMSPDASKLFKTWRDDIVMKAEQGPNGELWARGLQNAKMVAGALALGDTAQWLEGRPQLVEEHARWSIAFVDRSMVRWEAFIGEKLADSPHEQVFNDIKGLLSKTTSYQDKQLLLHTSQGWMPYGGIQKRLKKYTSKQLKEALVLGVEWGEIIECERQSGSGPKVKCYRLTPE